MGSITRYPTQDVWALNTEPLINKEGTLLSVAPTNNRIAFTQHSLVGLSGKNFTEIYYQFYVTTLTGSGDVTLTMYRSNTSWDESTLTYNNMPGITGDALGSVTFSTLGTKKLYISNFGEFAKLISDNNGMVIKVTSGDRICNYYSSEGSVLPFLVLTYSEAQKIFIMR